ncbi:pyridoxal phosphate-dependent aminotransferase [Romboutsia ilealis]|uniref:Aminotransferase n=1 Tax=Romboutsia faecis TaxID=2764597 RepID=A0ABR7JN26_9FIRM|nr:pyridoxal phosphate-dependent aminotransferase [Romboutsia faecis]MBC5996260.1 pyridoxal phosphate-dependent aminotransferase [Romboutsia faecis]MRN25098.1 pyridoxal phosphate-dependent aminotransferase [Romboutsia ilealis]
MKYSKRVSSMQSSPIRKLASFEESAKKGGVKVYHLNIGQPDIKTPKAFFKAINDFDKQVLEYCSSSGLDDLINSMQKYYNTYNIKFSKDELLVTNGGSEALLFALMAICDPDDNVLVPEPFYTNYFGFGQSINVKINPITTKAENGFHLPSKEDIISKINHNTKAIMISNPSNPSGTVYTYNEIKMLSEIALEYNLWIISDEVYREFVYDNQEYTSFGNIPEIYDRVIIIDSISKRYSACGARIGSIASKNKGFIAQVLKLCQGRLCVSTLDQVGAAKLYETPISYFKEVIAEYEKRRNVLYDELMKVDGVVCEKPSGAFYILAKLPIDDAEDFAIWMLEEFSKNNETVMICPAQGFYATEKLGKNEIRLAYILNEKDLITAAKLLKEGLEEYLSSKIKSFNYKNDELTLN